MSVSTRSPLRMVGGVVFSGAPNTGEIRFTRGGDQTFWSASGVAVDTVVFSGAGRLNTVTRLTAASGAGVYFYNGIVATSGGPFATSGHVVLATILEPRVLVSGSLSMPALHGVPIDVDMPFASGLIIAPIGSGTPSFCLSYSVEVNPAIG